MSAFQSAIDWAKVKKSGIEGAIIRCGYRGYEKGNLAEDFMFTKHITGAHKAGVPVGIYFFTEAISAAEGKAEAEYAIKLWKKTGIPLAFPIAVDTEAQSAKNERAKNLSKAKRTEVIAAFCEEVKRQGYEPMIYASTSWLNNKLDMSKLPYKVWVAQYNSVCEYKGKYILWQYTSKGSVSGVKGNVDMNYCYMNVTAPAPEPTKAEPKGYDGEMPSLHLVKTTAQVIADTITWAKWIAGDNSFHYGACNKCDGSPKPKKNADHKMCSHHCGCYFCGTNASRKSKYIEDRDKTYCCNTLITAAFAHGGCVPEALKLCQNGNAYDFGTKGTSFHTSKQFDNLGKLAKSKLKAGDVLCLPSHVKMCVSGSDVVEAEHRDDNIKGSSSWNDSIAIHSIGSYDRVYRFNSKVDTTMLIRYGEVSARVALLQKFLIWYGVLPAGADDGIFGDATLNAVKAYQKAVGLTADGIVGKDTLASMPNAER